MRKMIKKINSKWILLFLFTFMSVTVNGQIDGEPKINWSTLAIPNQTEHTELEPRYTYEIIVPITPKIVPMGLTISQMNLNVTMVNQIPVSTTLTNFNTSSLSPSSVSNFDFLLNSLYNSFGTSWGLGESGSLDFPAFPSDIGGGIHDLSPQCNNTCPIGYYLIATNCLCAKKPCDTQLKTKINTFTNDAVVKSQILDLQNTAKTEEFERGTAINKDPTSSSLTSPGLGIPGTSSSVAINIGNNTTAILHSHSYNALSYVMPAPSPGDIYTLLESYVPYRKVEYLISVGVQNAYVLYIQNPDKLNSFVANYPKHENIIAGTGEFIERSELDNVLNSATKKLGRQGLNENDADASALAYFLEYYNIGLVLYESPIAADGSTNFYAKNTTKTVTPAQPATATTPKVKETTTYTNIDCP